ncbi:hypothetical protein V8G54_025121 [Vigna mungo]|uniref:Uncharacterized protein n=1 Tax=Vigna mungo TaxID=3915 RepID=A0AAQ3N8G2_VIGMU
MPRKTRVDPQAVLLFQPPSREGYCPNHAERPPSPEVALVRKHKVSQPTKDPRSSKKGKDSKEQVDPEADQLIPSGMWDLGFNLGHKIDFHFDKAEQRFVEETSEQKLADDCMELACQTATTTWTLAYASNRGVLRAELDQVKARFNEQRADTEMKKARNQLVADLEESKKENQELKKIVEALTMERNVLCQTVAEDKEVQKDMGDAIVLENTRGFKKALRQMSYFLKVSTEGINFDPQKDVSHGELVSIGFIPAGTFPNDDDIAKDTPVEKETTKAGADAIITGEMIEGNPHTTDVDIVNIG